MQSPQPRVLDRERPSGTITAEYLEVHPRAFDARLRDGRGVRVRPIVSGDRSEIARALERMSPQTRYLRFHRAIDAFSDRDLSYLSDVDQRRHVAWGVIALDVPRRPGIAAARFIRDDDDPTRAEFAIAIVDAFQGVGLGRILMQTIVLAALEGGIERLIGYVLHENRAAIRLFQSLGAETYAEDSETLRMEIPVTTGQRDYRLSMELPAVAELDPAPTDEPGLRLARSPHTALRATDIAMLPETVLRMLDRNGPMVAAAIPRTWPVTRHHIKRTIVRLLDDGAVEFVPGMAGGQVPIRITRLGRSRLHGTTPPAG